MFLVKWRNATVAYKKTEIKRPCVIMRSSVLVENWKIKELVSWHSCVGLRKLGKSQEVEQGDSMNGYVWVFGAAISEGELH